MVTIHTSQRTTILILGAGWTSTFLIPFLKIKRIPFAATTTTGRDSTLPFKFEYDSDTESLSKESRHQLAALPRAETVLITFPLKGVGRSKALLEAFSKSHHEHEGENLMQSQFIQLGSSGIFSMPSDTSTSTPSSSNSHWITRHSAYDTTSDRAIAEDELLTLGGCVLNLSGLWGGERHPRNWIERVAATKEALATKGSLHLIHGEDVARAVVGVHERFEKGKGERFILTDLLVYDWWELALGLSSAKAQTTDTNSHSTSSTEAKQPLWVLELMKQENIRALPRSMQQLGRCYDTRDFWETFGIAPVRGRV